MTFIEYLTVFQSVIALLELGFAIYVNKVSKKNNNKENNYSLAFDLCMDFQRRIIPEYINVVNFHKKHNLRLIEEVSVDTEKGYIKKPQKLKKHADFFLQKVMFLFNDMDMFANKLLTAEQNEEYQAFEMQGRAYCEIINHLINIYDLFLLTHKNDYHFLSELYNLWNERILRELTAKEDENH